MLDQGRGRMLRVVVTHRETKRINRHEASHICFARTQRWSDVSTQCTSLGGELKRSSRKYSGGIGMQRHVSAPGINA